MAAAFILAVIVAGIYKLGEAEDARYLEAEQQHLQAELGEHKARLIAVLNAQMQLPLGLAAYVSQRGDVEPQMFRDMAASLLANSRGIFAIELARDNRLSHIYPLKGNEKALGLDLLSLPEQSVAVRQAINSRRGVLFGPRRLVQGGTAMIGQIPIYVPSADGSRYWGLAVALMDMQFMLAEAGLLSSQDQFRHLLYRLDADGSRHTIHGDLSMLDNQPLSSAVDIDVMQSRWRLVAVPPAGWLPHSPNRQAINLLGALLAIFASLLFWHLLRLPMRLQKQAVLATTALQASEARFAAVSHAVPIPVTLTSLESGKILDANPAAAAFLAVPKGKVAGRPASDFFANSDEMQEHSSMLQSAGQVEGFEMQIRKHSGETAWVMLHSQLAEMEGEPVVICSFLDITERVHASELLQKMNVELEQRVNERTDELQCINERLKQEIQERQHLSDQLLQAQKMESVGVMAGGIAHDFNNLLAGIMGNAELATMEEGLSTGMYGYLGRILAAALRGKELVSQMLAYSGKGKFVNHSIDLSDIAQEITQLLHSVISKKAELKMDLHESPASIEGDPNQIRQLIMNLITNASDALEGKSGTIRIRTGIMMADKKVLHELYFHAGMEEGRYAFIEVSDTGCGVPQGDIDKIFDPFFSTKFEGSGLGLSALMGIVRSHHGGIFIDSWPGMGTRFRILFPMLADPVVEEAENNVAATAVELQGTVLIVDDEAVVRNVTGQMLEQSGMQVQRAKSGSEGIERFEAASEDISIILLDRTMPMMDGDETFEALRRIRADVPIVMMSSYVDEAPLPERAAMAFLHKPFCYNELTASIARLLGQVGP